MKNLKCPGVYDTQQYTDNTDQINSIQKQIPYSFWLKIH